MGQRSRSVCVTTTLLAIQPRHPSDTKLICHWSVTNRPVKTWFVKRKNAFAVRYKNLIPFTLDHLKILPSDAWKAVEMIKLLRQFRYNKNGATGTEYAIIAAFLAITIVASVQIIGSETAQSFTNSADGIRNAAP